MSDHLSKRRLAENEVIFRRLNAEIKQGLDDLNVLVASVDDSESPVEQSMILHFYCECSDESCTRRIKIPLEEYGSIHKNKRRFMLLPGHEVPTVEKVVIRTSDYLVIEKFDDPPEKNIKFHKTNINNP